MCSLFILGHKGNPNKKYFTLWVTFLFFRYKGHIINKPNKLNKMKNLFKFAFAALTVAMLSTACGGAKTEEAAASTEEATPVVEETAAPVEEAAAPVDSAATATEAPAAH